MNTLVCKDDRNYFKFTRPLFSPLNQNPDGTRAAISRSPCVTGTQRSPFAELSPNTTPTKTGSCRTPRRRLLLDSAECSPLSSASSCSSSETHGSPADFRRPRGAVVARTLFSPEPSPSNDVDDVASGVLKLQIRSDSRTASDGSRQESSRRTFPRSSSLKKDVENDGPVEDMSMPLSPINVDDSVSHKTVHFEQTSVRDSGLGSLQSSSLWMRRHPTLNASPLIRTPASIFSKKGDKSTSHGIEASDDSLFMELEAMGCLSPVAETTASPAIAQLIKAPILIDQENVPASKSTLKRPLFPGKESSVTPKSKKRKAPLPVGRGPRLSADNSPTAASPCRGDHQSDLTQNLLPDGSGQSYRLPTIFGRHPDLKTISGSTVSDLLDGFYPDISFRVVDSRYPYEYEGGHVKNAENLYTEEAILERMFSGEGTEKASRVAIIFHCEFSAERGPRLMRFLRNRDRAQNGADYPKLSFPEMYLLEGGYKKFFESYSRHCAPQNYVKMLDKNYQEEMKMFRRKSKSMTAETSRHVEKSRLARSRSGLHF